LTDRLTLQIDGPIAVISNENPDKRNAFDDAMDRRLWEIFGELRSRPDVRAVIWRGEGKAFSSGRDVGAIGAGESEMTHHELMSQGHRGAQQIFELDAPIAEDARFMLPEVTHGVIPDTGSVARLFQMCGHGVASDMVLTGRPMDAAEASAHGVVSRVVSNDGLDDTAWEIARKIAAAPAVTVKRARRVIRHLGEPEIRSSMAEELIAQTFINKSDDYAELRAARAEEREPHFTGS
jgi:enoyl-CoA hydratase/carnithine racemase